MRVVAHRVTDHDGTRWDLVYDTDDIAAFETPIDAREVPAKPGDDCVRREMGQAHLVLHFKDGTGPTWTRVEAIRSVGLETPAEEGDST